MVFWEGYVSDEVMGIFAPIVIYWLYAGFYQLLPPLDEYRLHTRKEEEEKNLVPLSKVIKGVLLQQLVQAVVAHALFLLYAGKCFFMALSCVVTARYSSSHMDSGGCGSDVLVDSHSWRMLLIIHYYLFILALVSCKDKAAWTCNHKVAGSSLESSLFIPKYGMLTSSADESGTTIQPSIPIQIMQIIIGMIVMDTWQYFAHRYMHQNKFLYRHIHSQHHRLVVTYAIGALYNHPVEGLLLDTVGGAIAFLVSGMTARTSVIFFCFAVVKTVDDHCGLWLPGNIFHIFFQNNTAYHDIHHQLPGTKYNYSQPFFSIWDKLLGTHMPYTLVNRPEGGLEARLVKD
ncbi:hypothetical protein POTOM_021749 [Populus tomentosa]|uniref:Fatty acid hydroxylase domain-containing protein n=1 Tax=Populus tomentosa TaxID=118781 RepID=A0A8X8CSS3_POPTO|nr:hypothetical protein POTOM_021749 [Populus tomentosa]